MNPRVGHDGKDALQISIIFSLPFSAGFELLGVLLALELPFCCAGIGSKS